MLRPIVKVDCTHAYAGLLVLVAIFMALFTAAMQGQELPNAPQAAAKQQKPPAAHRPLPVKSSDPDLGSADWFRDRGHFKMARFVPVFRHIDWDISYGKPKETGHGCRKGGR
jgi:hypothetical protein